MAKQVVGLFDNMADAHGAVQELTNAGFTSDNISIVANNASGETTNYDSSGSEAAEGAGAGAVGGAVLGGLGGLLVGLGALAIPGVGPVIAAGTLATALGTTAVGAGLGAAAGGLVGALVGAGIPEDDANLYAEGIRRGGALVTVQASTDAEADRAADILDRYNVVDIDERGASYRSSGWNRFDDSDTTYARGGVDSDRSAWDESSKVGTAGGTLAGAATGAAIGSVGGPVGTVIGGVAGAVTGAGVGAAGDAAGETAADAAMGEDDASYRGTRTGSGVAMGSTTDYTTTSTDFQTGTRDISTDQGEIAIPVVEEEIRVGKREIESGGVRVETRVEATPVNEQVTLREETVTIERRPVDQPVDAATLTDAFREGTFEVREHDEQAVVQKEARIVEEIVVGKQVEQRTETIQDTVRRTDVDVQQIQGETRSTGFTETSRVSSSDVTGSSTGFGSTVSSTGTGSTLSGSGTVDSGRSEWEESSKAGTTGGTIAGAATGAAIGAVGGPVGSVIGGIAGAVTGAGVGAAGDAAGEAASDAATGEDDATYRSGSTGEGAIEGGLSRTGNAVERGTGLDLDRDGDTGQRDTRNNF